MIVRVAGLSYSYPAASARALCVEQLELPEGGLSVVAGPSAGGKSTLLRLFNGLVPQFYGGRLELASGGVLEVAGRNPARTPPREMARHVGMVFQDPEGQAIADVVEAEIAFGMEQQGVPPAAMRHRLETLLAVLGIDHLRHRLLVTLSGGERQRVAIAAALALEPGLLCLDEPTSQIDPAGADAVLGVIDVLVRRGLTVVAAEHRLHRLLPVADRVIAVDDGAVSLLDPRVAATALASPPVLGRLSARLGLAPAPLTAGEARVALQGRRLAVVPTIPHGGRGDELLRVDDLTVVFGEYVALRDCTLALAEGEIVALAGPNGAGKSTLLRAIAGLTSPARGAVRFCGAPAPATIAARTAYAGLVPQEPARALYRESVVAELKESLRLRRLRETGCDAVAAGWALQPLVAADPRDLSGGQQQRVAVAVMLAHAPPVWLLDEPTRGADGPAREFLAQRLREHAAAGGAAIVATHDREWAATFATRLAVLEGGRLTADLPARVGFSAQGPCPTVVAGLVPGALLPEEVVACED